MKVPVPPRFGSCGVFIGQAGERPVRLPILREDVFDRELAGTCSASTLLV